VTRTPRSSIPLFPLGTVLFPGVVLPLHVFEPRYRALVRRLMTADDRAGREFGVVGIRQGWEIGADGVEALYDVGCTAELRQVTPYDDGRFDIVSVGRRRFRLDEVDAAGEPYLCGSVEWLADSPSEVGEPELLARSVGELFLRCRRLLRAYEPVVPADDEPAAAPVDADYGYTLPDDPQLVSHLVATAAPFTLDERQSLLAAASTTDRLRQELRLLKREVTMLSRLRAVPVPLAELRVPMGPN
jgi:Lon protease-like protein